METGESPGTGWRMQLTVVAVALPILAVVGELMAPPRWHPQFLASRLKPEALPPIPPTGDARRQQILEHEVIVSVVGRKLAATIVAPADPGSYPGIVLVAGAGSAGRNELLAEARAFARSGILALTYDKRSKGYSFNRRDYRQLAGDALAMVGFLQAREEVTTDRVGLWGLSEGGSWVVPLAAARSEEVAFSILASPTFISPLAQVSFALADHLHRSSAPEGMLTLVGRILPMGAFPYTQHESIPILAQIRQPVLALYGAEDREIPLVESARHLADGLDAGGNADYTIRYLEGADHGLRLEDGRVAPDSIAVAAAWIHHLPELPDVQWAGATPDQIFGAEAPPPSPSYATGKVLLAAFALQAIGYLVGPIMARLGGSAHRLRLADPASAAAWNPIKRGLHRLAGAGISSALLINVLMGVEVGLAATETYSGTPLHVGWAIARLLGLAMLWLGVTSLDRVVSARKRGWSPDTAQGVAIGGVCLAAALQTSNNTYLGLFDLRW